MHFIGFTVSKDGVRPVENNVAALLDIRTPSSNKQLHSFLGTANYYYFQLVPNFAQLAEPRPRLLQTEANCDRKS